MPSLCSAYDQALPAATYGADSGSVGNTGRGKDIGIGIGAGVGVGAGAGGIRVGAGAGIGIGVVPDIKSG